MRIYVLSVIWKPLTRSHIKIQLRNCIQNFFNKYESRINTKQYSWNYISPWIINATGKVSVIKMTMRNWIQHRHESICVVNLNDFSIYKKFWKNKITILWTYYTYFYHCPCNNKFSIYTVCPLNIIHTSVICYKLV